MQEARVPGRELIDESEMDAVLEVFKSGGVLSSFGFADERTRYMVREFEKAACSWLGTQYAVAVSSGTAALKVALDALGVTSGDEVVTQCFAMVATIESILATGARPVVTEVDETLGMCASDLRRKITRSTKAIVPVHMLGAPSNLRKIQQVANEFDVPLVEDAAQAFGASLLDRRLGTIGALGIYSFDFAKTITTGEGGMVVTSDFALFEAARRAHDHGHDYRTDRPRFRDTHSTGGFNFRLSELQAAVGLAQLEKIDKILSSQRENWYRLRSALPRCITLRQLPEGAQPTYDTLVMVFESANEAREINNRLALHNVPTWVVPASLDWHFAGRWDHILPGTTAEAFPQSALLLARTVAIHVPVLLTSDFLQRWVEVWR